MLEILNVELEPSFLGQGLGRVLLKAALASVPGDAIVVCQPTPTEFSNVAQHKAAAADDSFYRKLGFATDDRLRGLPCRTAF
jgi:GNAT superfamily N-acetyltransferase